MVLTGRNKEDMINLGEDPSNLQLNRNSVWSSGACFVAANQDNLENSNEGLWLSRDGEPICTNVVLDGTRSKLRVHVAHVGTDECSVMEGPNGNTALRDCVVHDPIIVKSGCASIGSAGMDADLLLDGAHPNDECKALKSGPVVDTAGCISAQ
ncbi:cadmium-translocating P-type ATPase [Sesbania bispinosa]|nr:cadmium-translocating P-type ATPase [Sesbania bispinosa]